MIPKITAVVSLVIFLFFLYMVMSKQHVMSRESLKLIRIRTEVDVMKSCFYCRKCAKCSKFYEIMTKSKI